MSEYRRSLEGNVYFFTVVTYQRQPFLGTDESIRVFDEILNKVKQTHPFEVEACVFLHDHLHAIWRLPDGDSSYSMRWGLIKKEFSKTMKDKLHSSGPTASRLRHRENTVWQRRFWEHKIRDDSDFRNHMDYIHYNPVKHGLVRSPCDWKHSSFNRYVDEGLYPSDWGAATIAFADGIGAE